MNRFNGYINNIVFIAFKNVIIAYLHNYDNYGIEFIVNDWSNYIYDTLFIFKNNNIKILKSILIIISL